MCIRDRYIRAYDSLFAGTGKLCKDEGLFISCNDYATGYALYAFDLSADLGEYDHSSVSCFKAAYVWR